MSLSSQALLPVSEMEYILDNTLRSLLCTVLIHLDTPGISQATAVSFAREGCTKIVLADRDSNGLEKTQQLIAEEVGESKTEVLVVKTDVTSAEQIDQLVLKAVEKFGRIDYAVNGAGMISI